MAWWWTRREAIKEPSDVEERLRKVEGGLRALELEFESLYDKTRQALGRMMKRRDADVPEPFADPPASSSGSRPASPTNGIDPVSAKILALRRGPRVRPGGVR